MFSVSKSEYEILTLLWANEQGLTAVEINEIAEDKSWKPTSIHLIINSMMDKGVVKVDGMVRSGRTYSRIFKPALSPEEYSMMQIKQNASFSKDKNALISNLCAALIDQEEVSMETIEKIELLIKQKKEEQ
jgi:BlaI family penicillinase repressor